MTSDGHPTQDKHFNWRRVILLLGGALIGIAVLLFAFQGRLIYFPQRYADGKTGSPGSGLTPQLYTVDGNSGIAFWRAPKAGGRWWIAFSGNGGLALDWDYLLSIDTLNGFLLIDHPGYGANGGTPSPVSIDRNADAAFSALASQLHLDTTAFANDAGVLGHSLGAAIALRFAARHNVARVVVLAPFTTMKAMAQKQVGWPLSEVLRHRFDNRASIATLAQRKPQPTVTILHGVADELIPVTMSRALKQDFPWIELRELAAVDHNNIILRGDDIRAAMAR